VNVTRVSVDSGIGKGNIHRCFCIESKAVKQISHLFGVRVVKKTPLFDLELNHVIQNKTKADENAYYRNQSS
jgi:hypothetical protein